MGSKEVVIGLVIFIFVAILSFFFINQVLHASDTIAAISAIIIGAVAEYFYRKKRLS